MSSSDMSEDASNGSEIESSRDFTTEAASESDDDYVSLDDSNVSMTTDNEDDSGDDDLYSGSVHGHDKAPKISDFHQHFSQDLRLAEEHLQFVIVGKKCIDYSFNPIAFSWEVRLCIPLNVINAQFREWWGLNNDPFIRIELTRFDVAFFRKRNPPQVSALLPSSGKNVASQAIENACKAFLDKTWQVHHEDHMDPYEEDRGSYFLRLIGFLVGRLKELGNFCVQCGKKQLGAHPLLTVCDQDLCVFQRDLLRRNLGASMGPRLWSDSSELLIYLFGNANLCARRDIVCTPDPHKELDIGRDEIEKLLKGWCTRCTFTTWSSFKLFRESHSDTSNLLYWLSDRFPVICRLPPRFRINQFETTHQYLLPPVLTKKEHLFQCAKKRAKGKTFFAFHGSPVQNWYSIMCEGLQVCSGTSRQMVGQAYGSGIYLSKVNGTSAGYCKEMNDAFDMPHWEECPETIHKDSCGHLNNGTWCLGLCEVVDDRSKFTDRGYGDPHYVLTDPDCVQVRLLFIYEKAARSNFAAVRPELLDRGGNVHSKMKKAMRFFSEADFRERIAAVLDSNQDNKALADDRDVTVLPVNEEQMPEE